MIYPPQADLVQPPDGADAPLIFLARGSSGPLDIASTDTVVLALHCTVHLPNSDDAVIDPEKLRDYLLSSEHPHGRFKARFFGALGFRADHWQELESAFRTQHLTQDAEHLAAAAGGQKFRIRAILVGPEGDSAMVVSIWFVRSGEATPRFVTAYPGERR